MVPNPLIQSFSKSPSKMQPSSMRTPFPCLLLFRKSPLQRLPSGQLASPFPVRELCRHCPEQENPDLSMQVPQPLAMLLRNSPSQQLPSVRIILPLPSQTPSLNVPQSTSPFLNLRKPSPFGWSPSTSPSQSALRVLMQIVLLLLVFLAALWREGRSFNLSLTPSSMCSGMASSLLDLT